jgi:hypothetical protein
MVDVRLSNLNLRCQDNREFQATLPAGSIDLIFTSPPYNIGSKAPRRDGMLTVDGANIDGTTCPATRAIHIQPWHPGDGPSTNCRRPPHVAPCSEVLIPPFDDTARISPRSLGFGTRLPHCPQVGQSRSISHVPHPEAARHS